ncbi:MAG: octaprenyl diphosphate synthase [Deltaproteobacteria bacterium RBG_13_47_9]|nr:MAG: octaprenyl diphosphate synthase [Deltaproteobacteria bacterium RBG_13_47_9]
MEIFNECLESDLEKVDQEFRKNLKSDVPIISVIGEYLLSSGGKRLRAKLLLLSAKLCGYRGDQHISMASLIEFIHTATLLHDDVVDRAELRRGIDSANSKWGNEASVLVGDFLFTKCFSLLVQSENWKILRTISKATTIMAEGELEELIKTNDLSLTEEAYLSVITRKTASLISAAMRIGAILGNVSEDKERALSDFGMDVGMAFQLIDDNLDYTSNEEEFGKKIGIDLQEGKITLPLIFTLSHCNEEERTYIRKAVESDLLSKEAFFRVVEIIEQYHGIQYTWEKAGGYIERAKGYLHVFPNSKEKEALFALANYVLERRL